MTDFFNTVRGYMLEYLPKQRCLGENTITSYKAGLNQGQKPRYYAEGHHEAIVDRTSWNAAQEKMKAGIGAEQGGAKVNPVTGCAPHRSGKTVFSSKLFCGNCGAPLIRRSMASHAGSVRGTRCYLWKCRNAEGTATGGRWPRRGGFKRRWGKERLIRSSQSLICSENQYSKA